MSPRRKIFPFWAKLALLTAVVATIPLAIAGWWLIDVNTETVRTLHRILQLTVLDDVRQTIDNEAIAVDDDLHRVARTLSDRTRDEDTRISAAAAVVEASQRLDHVALYGADGRFIDAIREASAVGVPAPASLPPALLRDSDRDDSAAGEITSLQGVNRGLVVVPIRAEGRITGYVASAVSLAPVQRRIERLAATRFDDQADSLFVVDDDFRVLVHADPERALGLPSARGAPILAAVSARGLNDKLEISEEFVGDDGVERVGSVMGMARRPWFLVAQLPRAVAYRSLFEMRRIVLWVLVGAALGAALLGVVFARGITAPLGRLRLFAERLAARRFDERVVVETRDELAVLGDALSGAAVELAASEQALASEVAIRQDLGRYLPAQLVDQVVNRTQDMALGGERRSITVLFADVVAFTPLAERLGPEAVTRLLNDLFTVLTEIIFRSGGIVDKFMGDCVMAVWGAPTPSQDHATRAVRAAQDMLRWVEAANAGWQSVHGARIQLAIGVHSGDAIVGNLGSKQRMEYTAIGDAVNLAARLESVARPEQILVSRATRELAGDAADFLPLGARRLAGLTQAVELFEVRNE